MQNTPSSERPVKSNYRWTICAMLFWVTTANYIDRSVFGNLAPELQKTIGWTSGEYLYMQVGFNIAYAISLAVGGRLMDVIGLRWGFVFAVAFWGLASISHVLAATVTGFFVVRFLLGLGEGSNFPAAIKTTAEWFPKRERALATGIFNSGSNIGGMLVPVALPAVVALFSSFAVAGHVLSWRGAFIITGVIDLAWIVVWLKVYKKPEEHPKVSTEELALINSDPPEKAAKIPWRRLIPHRQTWAFAVAKGMTDCFWWFYLVAAAPFFFDRFHLGPAQRAVPVGCIYVFASVGSIGGGWLSGYLMKKGWTVNRARKTTLLAYAILVVPVYYACITENLWVAVALITLAASAHQAWSANVFSLVGDMFPRRVVGSVVGLGGMAGSIGGTILFLVGGWLRDKTGNYNPIFIAASVSYVIAILIVHLLVPRMEPATVDDIVAT